jgi:hypothetical protein
VGGEPEQIASGPTEEEGVATALRGRSLITSVGTDQSALWVHDSRGDREVSSEGFSFLNSIGMTSSPNGHKLWFSAGHRAPSLGQRPATRGNP